MVADGSRLAFTSKMFREYLDFLREKRRQIGLLLTASVASGALAAVLVAVLRGGNPSEALPAVEAMAELLIASVVLIVAYGFTQGGLRREF